MKHLLSPSQSATLIAKGISADKASKGERIYKTVELQNGSIKRVFDGYAPIFTLADICALLPKEIEIDAHRCGLNMWYHNAHYWMVSYVQFNGAEIAYQSPVVSRDALIDALYEFLCLCIRNGYINFTK